SLMISSTILPLSTIVEPFPISILLRSFLRPSVLHSLVVQCPIPLVFLLWVMIGSSPTHLHLHSILESVINYIETTLILVALLPHLFSFLHFHFLLDSHYLLDIGRDRE
ncbi:hypothetical protein PENTCL1PPCAC_11670, partial [Pristionchus entomophagus]